MQSRPSTNPLSKAKHWLASHSSSSTTTVEEATRSIQLIHMATLLNYNKLQQSGNMPWLFLRNQALWNLPHETEGLCSLHGSLDYLEQCKWSKTPREKFIITFWPGLWLLQITILHQFKGKWNIVHLIHEKMRNPQFKTNNATKMSFLYIPPGKEYFL